MFDRAIACVEGYLGDNPEVRETQKGRKIISLSVGVNKSVKNSKTDEWESNTQWFKVKVINPHLVEKATKCKKGAYVRAEGDLEQSSYTKNKSKITFTEIVLSGDGSTFRYKNKSDNPA